jgi:hypothetical protein
MLGVELIFGYSFINLLLLAGMAVPCAITDSYLEHIDYPAGAPWLYDDNSKTDNPSINGLVTWGFALVTLVFYSTCAVLRLNSTCCPQIPEHRPYFSVYFHRVCQNPAGCLYILRLRYLVRQNKSSHSRQELEFVGRSWPD